jgi:hypothetical protein
MKENLFQQSVAIKNCKQQKKLQKKHALEHLHFPGVIENTTKDENILIVLLLTLSAVNGSGQKRFEAKTWFFYRCSKDWIAVENSDIKEFK